MGVTFILVGLGGWGVEKTEQSTTKKILFVCVGVSSNLHYVHV